MYHVGMKPYEMLATQVHWQRRHCTSRERRTSDGVVIGGTDRARRSMLQSFRYDEAVADELGLSI